MRKYTLTFALVLAALLGLSVMLSRFVAAEHAQAQQKWLTTLTDETKTVTRLNSSTEPVHRSAPVLISIPRLQVVAPIQPVGLDEAGRMATIPNAHVIAWYAYGSTPGGPGNAILAGHRDWNGLLGSFWGIERLKANDPVYIKFSSGVTATFRVVSDTTYPASEVPAQVMDLAGPPRLTLITCVGDFVRSQGGYQSRVVVVLKNT